MLRNTAELRTAELTVTADMVKNGAVTVEPMVIR